MGNDGDNSDNLAPIRKICRKCQKPYSTEVNSLKSNSNHQQKVYRDIHLEITYPKRADALSKLIHQPCDT